MIERFQGAQGLRLLAEALGDQKMLRGAPGLAEEVSGRGELIEFAAGEVLIEQGDQTNDVYLILAGSCEVVVNGRRLAARGPGDHVGEMAAVQPTQPRSATVRALDPVVAVKLTEEAFSDLGRRYSSVYLTIAKELARRLLERNRHVGGFRDRIRLFVISSVEALPVAQEIQDAFEHEPIDVQLWTQGCFKAASYTVPDLEAAVDNSDFAVAIAHADDVTESRSQIWPAPRDNVVFELGLFMGRLGLKRAILMEPRGKGVKLPSDLSGITTITYNFKEGGENERLMGPACSKLRKHMKELGPFNG